MIINWYPGHMAKARRLIEANLKLVDVVIELLDARIPRSSSNPMLAEIIGNKKRIIILNKADLADEKELKMWQNYYKEENLISIAINSKERQSAKNITNKINFLANGIIEKWLKRGMNPRNIRVMILGIPNVGKSTLINMLAKTAATKTANKPGATKGKQWIKLNSNIELLDTPGILWPKLEDQTAAYRLAATGAISSDAYDLEYVSKRLIEDLLKCSKDKLVARYKLDENIESKTVEEIFNLIGKNRGCLLAKGLIDSEKTGTIILNELREGKLGKIILDKVDEIDSINTEGLESR